MRAAVACVIALGTLAPCVGCERSASPTTRASRPNPDAKPSRPAAAEESAPKSMTYKLVGQVRRVDPGSGTVSIHHEEIPGVMGAMTMPFTLKDRTILDDLHPGDEVVGTLRVEWDRATVQDYELVDLVVTRPAPAPVTVAPEGSGSGGKLGQIRPAPRRLEPGEMVPDFTMTTQEGRTLALSELRGKVVVLTFIYTRCPLPDFCPLMDRKFKELAGKVDAMPGRAAQVRLLSVSFDPEHDTPEVLRKHAQVQGARPPLWTFAVAPHDELAKVAGPLGLMYGPRPDEIIHNLSTSVIDPEGRLARLEVGASGKRWQPSDLLKAVNALIVHPAG
ncbi:MAG: SCO family protein [Planctomycetaceae bacterium]|nr:SCO family protein [Planctomycetaceae bacterium]